MTARTRQLRLTVVAALAVALSASPTALAQHGVGSAGAVVPVHKVGGTPAGEFIGEGFAEDFAAHAGDPRLRIPARPSEQSARRWSWGPAVRRTHAPSAEARSW
jgi:hypothetical protein